MAEITIGDGDGGAGAGAGHETKDEFDDYDYVFVFKLDPAGEEACGKISVQLGEAYLKTKRLNSVDVDEIFLLVRADDDILERHAERIKYRKQLKAEKGGAFKRFKIAKKDMFEPAPSLISNSFFTPHERKDLILDIIIETPHYDGANIDVTKCIPKQEGWLGFTDFFPIHQHAQRDKLKKIWFSRPWYKPQPLNQVREYYGEYIGLYFAFLGYYAKWLIFPAIVGTPMFIAQLVIGYSNAIVPIYCIFLAVWSTVFLEIWGRRAKTLAARWDTIDYDDITKVRAAFTGKKRYGVYVDGEFVALTSTPNYTPPEVPYRPKASFTAKLTASLTFVTPFVGAAIFAAVSVIVFRNYIQGVMEPTVGKVLAGAAYAVFIQILNFIYRKIAIVLTDWENHLTQKSYDNNLILKSFLFQFANSYTSLFYLAFVKGRVNLFGQVDVCTPNCTYELTLQLASLMATNFTIGQVQEVAIPWLKKKALIYMETRQSRVAAHPPTRIDEENRSQKFEELYDEYIELIMQFGFVMLFAAAFPLAPLLALINNAIEMRTDALKYLMERRRPLPRRAEDIGIWYSILNVVGFISVITNCGIIAYTSNSLEMWFPDVSAANVVWGMVAIEHGVLFIRAMIMWFVPNVPSKVRQLLARQKWDYEQAAEKLESIEQKRVERQKLYQQQGQHPRHQRGQHQHNKQNDDQQDSTHQKQT